jgi:hypothetical protein
VLTDSRIARGGGAPFRHEGQWYRLAQDCALGYGLGVHVLRIDELTPTTFRETRVATFRPSLAGPGWIGLHTLAVGDGIVVLDAYRNVVNLAAGWKRVRAKLPVGRGGR